MKKPEEPVRRKTPRSITITPYYDSVREIIVKLEKFGVDLASTYFSIVEHYDDSVIHVHWEGVESDNSFNKKMDKYKKELVKYNEWEKFNSAKIKELEEAKALVTKLEKEISGEGKK